MNFGDESDLPSTQTSGWFDVQSVFIYNFSDHNLSFGLDIGGTRLNNNRTGGGSSRKILLQRIF